MTTLMKELRAVAERAGESDALLAPGRSSTSFQALLAQCERIGRNLAAHGIGAGDRVVVIVGNGPEMAAAFLAVAGHATCAPLNPAYTERELEFYFDDLAPKALLCDPSLPSLAPEIARRRAIPVLEIRPDLATAAGQFYLAGSHEQTPSQPAQASDVALILHTSGTTSRPKMVALSQANLVASAAHIARTLALTSEDRCLNIMPLFHIHGLIAGLTASLLAGASVVCTLGFDPERFPAQLADCSPTWITAVPTMYELISRLALPARLDPREAAEKRLRLLRSSSASLPPLLMRRLEDMFGVPVIEAYGMTEAAHQMTSNPLPPAQRKAGSVGLAAGPEVAIMQADGAAFLAANTPGEIVIRGPNVTRGYLANPEANAKAFCEGWFRTGDQGYLDHEGYLFITGRLKELINRGGEKVSPREIDEALLAIAGIRQAVAFALPHPTLGEDVAAAVVLEQGSQLDAPAIRQKLSEQLSPFKVPSRIVFLSEIPKGATGKVQRIGLAQQLADKSQEEYVAPSNACERMLVELWQEVLEKPRIGVTSNFFGLGGDSLRAVRISARAAELGFALPTDAVFREATIRALAPLVKPLVVHQLPGEDALGSARLYGFQMAILMDQLATHDFPSPSEVVLESERAFDRGAVLTALRALTAHHDAFRLRYPQREGRFGQELVAKESVSVEHCLREQGDQAFADAMHATVRGFDLMQPPLFRVLVGSEQPHRLVVVGHHLVADASAMQIVAEDFTSAYEQALRGQDVVLPKVATPFVAFLRRYDHAAKEGRFREDGVRWGRANESCKEREDLRGRRPFVRSGSVRHLPFELGDRSAQVEAFAVAHGMSVSEVLFAATAAGLRELAKPANQARILLINGGRDQPLLGNLARTVGCLATLVPMFIELGESREFESVCALTRAAFSALPSAGFSVSAALTREPPEVRMQVFRMQMEAQALFNYKGAFGPRSPHALGASGLRSHPSTYRPEELIAHLSNPETPMSAAFGLQTHYESVAGKLVGDLYYSSDLYSEQDMLRFRAAARSAIDSIRI
jgi:acyl-CoA synthetase (AMP-forming)/AMP-acid ligase II